MLEWEVVDHVSGLSRIAFVLPLQIVVVASILVVHCLEAKSMRVMKAFVQANSEVFAVAEQFPAP